MQSPQSFRVSGPFLLCAAVLSVALSALAAQPLPASEPAEAAEPVEPVERELDLERVVALALERNAALRAEVERQNEVDGGVQEAGADAWPQVDIVGNWTRSRNPALLNSPDFDDFIDLFPDFVPGEQELWTVGAEVTQPVYTGGKVRAALDLARLVVDITGAQIRAVELDTALDAAESWYALLAARSSLATVRSQESARRAGLEVVEARYELGDATRLELLRAQAALVEVAPVAAQAEGDIQVAESRLRAVLGLPASTPIQVAAGEVAAFDDPATDTATDLDLDTDLAPSDVDLADLADLADLDEPGADGPDLPRLDALLALARARRPELRDLELQADALERQRVVTVAEGKPQVEFSGVYGRQARLPEDLTDELFQDWRVTLGVTWNVFDGGRRKGQVAQLDSRKLQLDWQREELRRQIVAAIEQSLSAFRTALAREHASRIASAAAAEAERVARASYRQGVALQADLLDAQDQSIRRRLEWTRATFDRQIQSARLRRAVGLLPTESLDADSVSATPQETPASDPRDDR